MLAPHKTSTAFYYLGGQVSPLLGDQGLTQGSLQTSCGAEERAGCVCREEDHLHACWHLPSLSLWSPARRTIDSDLNWE